MIIWIILAALIIVVIYKSLWKNKTVVACLTISVLLVALTILATSRVYTASFDRVVIPIKDCRIIHTDDIYHIVHNGTEITLPVQKVTLMKANGKENAVVELNIETRHYRTNAPKLLYLLYYLTEPVEETSIIYRSAIIATEE